MATFPQVVAKDTFPADFAESFATGALPKPFRLKPDFFRYLDHYLKEVAIFRTSRLEIFNPQGSPQKKAHLTSQVLLSFVAQQSTNGATALMRD